eukprot:m.12316 g.12316  ORF g.12316 m.12316 type:complete len:280 (+) comp4634_c0_seq1:262-1101(+)
MISVLTPDPRFERQNSRRSACRQVPPPRFPGLEPSRKMSVVAEAAHDGGDAHILAGDAIEWEYGMRREMQEIIPNVFLGPYACAKKAKFQYLKDHGITHIVCAREVQEAFFVKANFPDDFRYLVLDLRDGSTESIIPHFPRVRDFLDAALAAGGRVLLHGNAGISRSGALLVSYMMDKFHLPYTEALRLIQLRRFCVSPNEGFQAQLQEYEPIYQAKRQVTEQAGNLQRKRNLEDYDSDDDISNRNPAMYPPAIEAEPLPGHGAYVRNLGNSMDTVQSS